MDIDSYISQVDSKRNVSDGGSAAFNFGDVILIKYTIPNKYGIARDCEEEVAKAANIKNSQGVRTPLHLEIKRTNNETENICWVLQEKAKGDSFLEYTLAKNNPTDQLIKQQELLDAPSSHYEKCVKDLCELFHMGIELKPKNIFYDKNKDTGGFTFIDLLGYDKTPLNSNSISDVLRLDKYIGFIYAFSTIYEYQKGSLEEKQKSLELSLKIRLKIFKAMKKVIPNFEQFERWVLRSYPNVVQEYFKNNSIYKEDLTLTEKDYQQFDEFINNIINDWIKKIAMGSLNVAQIKLNEIRIKASEMGLFDAWKLHKLSPIYNKEQYADEYDFESYRRNSLQNFIFDKFKEKLLSISKQNNNDYILQAKEDLIKEEKNKKL